MSDDKAYELLKAMAAHIRIKATMRDGKPVMQVDLFTDEGMHIGDFIEGAAYEPGEQLLFDLLAIKRFVELEEAKPKLKTVPRLKRVK